MLFSGSKEKHAETAPHLEHGPSFKKRLGWWVKSGREETITLDVTPEMAAEMLEYNDRNRPATASKLREYTEAMSAGLWGYTRTPIQFSDERLIDGQKRLMAVVKSGITARFDIAFGAPDDSFDLIDIGEKRTAGHIFAIHGVPNWTLAAAATGIVVNYEAGTTQSGVTANSYGRRSSKALYNEYQARPDLPRSIPFGRLFATNAGIAPPALMTALHYICAKHNRAQADEFFTKLATGENINRKDAVFYLRKRLLGNKGLERLSRVAIFALTLKAWNAMRGARPVGGLTYNPDREVMPRAR